jgi:hypothetical protein
MLRCRFALKRQGLAFSSERLRISSDFPVRCKALFDKACGNSLYSSLLESFFESASLYITLILMMTLLNTQFIQPEIAHLIKEL